MLTSLQPHVKKGTKIKPTDLFVLPGDEQEVKEYADTDEIINLLKNIK